MTEFADGHWYNVRIDEARVEDSNNGTPGIRLKLLVTSGNMTGQYIQDDHWISQNNADVQRQTFIKTFGYDIATEDLQLIEKLVGRDASIKVKMEEFPKGSGTLRAKVNRIRPPGMQDPELPPAIRIAQFFGRVSQTEEDEEWQKNKKF